jgi:hypothetical protein
MKLQPLTSQVRTEHSAQNLCSELNDILLGVDELLLPPSVPAAVGLVSDTSALNLISTINASDRYQADTRPAESLGQGTTESAEAMNERLNAVASQKQQAMRSKRFKAQDGSSQEKTEYEKMVSEYQSISGVTADDNFKWFVR